MARLLLAPAALAMAWTAGFAWFVTTTLRAPAPPPHADGIVVLTGGAERVAAGLRLLEANAADRLLVSGVGRAAEFPALAHRAGVDRSLAARVELGKMAESTHGNAAETADWVAAHQVRSLIVVTAGYHMPRALVELRQRLPGVTLYPVTVRPPALRAFAELATWRLLAGEYTKYLAAEIGLVELANRAGLSGHSGFDGQDNLSEHGG